MVAFRPARAAHRTLLVAGLLMLAACTTPSAVPEGPRDGAHDGASAAQGSVSSNGAAMDAAPLLRLSPASLGRTLVLQQQITVVARTPRGEARREIQALLEADATHTRLAALAGGQVLARLDWDGQSLRVERAAWAPAELVPERILSELQLALWPLDAIAAALPAGWRIDANHGTRTLRQGSRDVVEIRYPDAATIEFTQWQDGYTLTIRTLGPMGASRSASPQERRS